MLLPGETWCDGEGWGSQNSCFALQLRATGTGTLLPALHQEAAARGGYPPCFLTQRSSHQGPEQGLGSWPACGGGATLTLWVPLDPKCPLTGPQYGGGCRHSRGGSSCPAPEPLLRVCPPFPPRASLQGSEGSPKSSIPCHGQPGTPRSQTGPGRQVWFLLSAENDLLPMEEVWGVSTSSG